jgi:hypothetical protein
VIAVPEGVEFDDDSEGGYADFDDSAVIIDDDDVDVESGEDFGYVMALNTEGFSDRTIIAYSGTDDYILVYINDDGITFDSSKGSVTLTHETWEHNRWVPIAITYNGDTEEPTLYAGQASNSVSTTLDGKLRLVEGSLKI